MLQKYFLGILLMTVGFLSAQNITHGVIVGGVTPNSATFYVRTHEAAEVSMEFATDTFFASVLSVTDSTKAARDSSNLLGIQGLSSFTTYYYRVYVNGVLDTLRGSFKTFPAVGARGNYTWSVLSCQEFGTYNVFNAMQSRMPELVLHTGDFTYPDYQIPGDHRMDWGLQELSYRKRYKEQNMQQNFSSMAFDYVPDNHDGSGQRDNIHLVGSYTDSQGVVRNTITLDPVPAGAVENVFKGYYEFFPHYPPADSLDGMYHSYRYGNCEVFFLDCRHTGNGQDSTFRYDSVQNQWYFDPKPGQQLISPQQFNWLVNGLQNSTADWKFIVSQVMFNRQFRKVLQVGVALQNMSFNLGGVSGSGFILAHSIASNWCGYPGQQDSLLRFIQQKQIKDVVVLSGHVHTNVMDNGKNAGLPELNTGPAAGYGAELTYYIDSVMRLLGQGTALDSLWNGGGQGVENTNFKSGFGMVHIFGGDSVQMQIVDEDNQTVSSMTLLHSSVAPSAIYPLVQESCVVENIFPNPATNMVQVKLCGAYKPKATDRTYLIDLSGKVLSVSVPQQNFSVKNLPAGKYLYVYDYGAEVQTVPLQVNH